MDDRTIQFRVGVMVVATIIIAAILVLLFGEIPVRIQSQYTVYIHFPDASGVSRDTPIRLSGILIGRVRDVAFAEDEGVIVTAGIYSNIRLRHNQVCRITGSLLGGDSQVQFVRSRDPSLPDTYIQDGELIAGVVASDPLSVISNLEGELSTAIRSIGSTSSEIGELAGQITGFVENNGDQFNRIILQAERSLAGFESAVRHADEIIGDPMVKEDLRRAVSSLPELFDDTRAVVERMQGTLDSVDRNLANIEGVTRPLGERGEEMVMRIDSITGRLDELTFEFTQFARALNNPEGSLGQLLNNPEVYQNINSAAENIERLTRELRPIVHDARVFSDKIARHPETIGVGGALRRSSGLK